jgi:hypothetical protein
MSADKGFITVSDNHHHQLPMHCQLQANCHPRSVLQHLVPHTVSKTVFGERLLTCFDSPHVNATTVVPVVAPTSTAVGTVVPPTAKATPFTGAGNKAVAGSAAALGGLLGVAAYFL